MGYGQFSARTASHNGQSGRKNAARKKTVYDTSEIAHLWAHKQTDRARNGGTNNFYFEGDTIFSYGTHFPIARHVEYKGRGFILFTTRTYSVTTSGHISMVRHAIPPDVRVFHVDNPYATTQEVLKQFAGALGTQRKRLATTKKSNERVSAYRGLLSAVNRINEFAEFLGYKRRWKTGLNAAETKLLDTACKNYDDAAQKRSEAAQRAADTRRAKERERYARIEQERQREALEWAEKQSELIARWRKGENSIPWNRLHSLPPMCRIVGDTVETSKGAEFPVAHALRVLPIVERLLTTGQTYQRNGHSIHLGHYTLDSIDGDGTVHAGCHHVPRAEVQRLITLLKALP